MSVKGYILQVQPFSVNDGDGIRTTVFLAGCPLRCRWCSNPEGFRREPLVGWYARRCIGCKRCEKVCPEGIGINLSLQRDRCTACGKCVEVCPKQARAWMVREVDAEEILQEIQTHRLFYSMSGGGVTFSGGEATSQPEFLDCLTKRIYDMGYSMDLETCGFFDFDSVRDSLARMDLIFMDLKHMDSTRHEQLTGVPNEKILENIRRLGELPGQAVIRIPVIGGANDDEENICRSASFVREHLPKARMELLPYHTFGTIKYEALGLPYDHPEFTRPDAEHMQRLRKIVEEEGVTLADFR